MEGIEIIRDIEERLNNLTIHELRQVARQVGVARPSDGKKERILEDILNIAIGNLDPVPHTSRGAPPKSNNYDAKLVEDIEVCRECNLAILAGEDLNARLSLIMNDKVHESEKQSERDFTGILYRENSNMFLYGGNSGEDSPSTFVPNLFVEKYNLREGDYVSGKTRRKSGDGAPGLIMIDGVNGLPAQYARDRKTFENFTRIYPDKRIKTSGKEAGMFCRMTDMFAPVALGQRSVVSVPVQFSSHIVKQLARGISENYPDLKISVLLIGGQPEEVTEYARTLSGAELFSTTFEMGDGKHISTADLAFEYCKRQVETGKDVLLLAKGLHNPCFTAEKIKSYLYNACNAEEGASLTVITMLPPEYALLNEISGILNMYAETSAELSVSRTDPAIDFTCSYSDGEEALLDKDELKAIRNIRKSFNSKQVVALFEEYDRNSEIIEKYKNG